MLMLTVYCFDTVDLISEMAFHIRPVKILFQQPPHVVLDGLETKPCTD